MSLPPAQLRNVQALAGVFSMPFLYLAMAFGMPTSGSFVIGLARAFPAWALWTPPGLVVETINAATPERALGLLVLLLAQVTVLLWIGMQVLRYQLRNGVVASGSRETARRPLAANRPQQTEAGLSRFLPRSPIKRRELRLLGRDRNFLVQSLLLPVIMVGSQMLMNGKLSSISQLGASPTLMAAIAFGIGSYVLMLSAFQTLNNEGQALWMLFTFPRSLESVLKEKAQLWAVLALVYPLTIFGVGIWLVPTFKWETLILFVIVLVGIPVYSVIAVALGVFACDPLAQDIRTRVRPSYVYLYILLAGLYIYAIYTGIWSQKLVVMVLTASLAQALWQKARDELPYLLDSAASPPARVSTSDGLIAAMLFFVLQGIAYYVLVGKMEANAGQSLVLAFGIAGAVAYLLTRLVYWTSKTSGVPVVVQRNAGGALSHGLVVGLIAAVAGLGYLYLLKHSTLWADIAHANLSGKIKTPWLFALAVVAAPLCEEFIFRGLIFGGMRRSMGLAPAMLMSAALFAIAHPPVSILPVFVLGLCTAYAYERSKMLLAPMLVHAIYNAAVITYQLSF
jgi:ABC-2 type transport system permease protein